MNPHGTNPAGPSENLAKSTNSISATATSSSCMLSTESVFPTAAVYSQPKRAVSDIVATTIHKKSSATVPYHPYVLPTVSYHGKEYTVDDQQEEFRNVKYGESPIFVPFDSALGETLLAKYQRRKRRDSHAQQPRPE